MLGALRIVLGEPLLEESSTVRQPHDHVGSLFAPAAAAASRTCSIVLSFSAGTSAAIITPHGTPFSFSFRTTSRRRCGLAARGSSFRASLRSLARADRDERFAGDASAHRTEEIEIALDERRLGNNAHRVLYSASTSRICRVMRYLRSIG